MALQNKDKKLKIVMPICPFCGAVAKHYGYQCLKNPRNQCTYCHSPNHTSLMCFYKPRRRIKKESEKTLSLRTEFNREWDQLNPPDGKGTWVCYLQISPLCPVILTKATIRREHVKSKTRYPELKYVLSNVKPACDFCNKLKGSLDLEELPSLSVIRLPEGRTWADILIQKNN